MRATLILSTIVVLGCSKPEEIPQPKPEPKLAESAEAKTKKTKPVPAPSTEVDEVPKDDGPPTPTAKKPFAVKTFDAAAVPKELTIEGKIETGAAWTDAYGDNLAILARRETKGSAYLRAYHFAKSASAWKLVREVKDQYEQCDYDNVTKFVVDSVRVTDEDKNGIGELGFAYVVDCTSDVSPNTAKLLLLEGGSKAIFRGNTKAEGVGGDYKPDPAKEKWKPALFARAESEWKRLFY